ncbi:uncharacterized protein LOC124152278 [Haliotis rufescens]|uniref:uncharacterized protein LOC124152278 n=1 Tax=Haliotis rufescens TaxID=6454 RepID=UPI00201E7724|nr:uncharacterized protein LOC124152278 [Haliotis rufescens]
MVPSVKVIGTALVFLCVALESARSNYCNVAINTDIVIAIHDSASTMQSFWGGLVISPGLANFLRSFVTLFDLTKVRISLVAYGTTTRELTGFTNQPQTLQTALRWRPEFGAARTYDAVRFISNQFRANARPNTAKLAIFLTNRASDNYIATVSESIQLRAEEVAVIGVAFGQSPTRELVMMAGGNGQQVVSTTSDYLLIQQSPRIKRTICYLVQLYQQILARRPTTTSTVTPLSVVSNIMLVLDHSDSTRRFSGLTFTWASALSNFANAFANRIAPANGACTIGLTTFSDTATTRQQLTGDATTFTNAVNTVAGDSTITFAGSNIAGAITQAANELTNNGNAGAQKVIYVVVDGSPNDAAAVEAAAQAAAAAGITVYAVSLQTLSGLAVTQATLDSIAQDPVRTFPNRDDANLVDLTTSLPTAICPPVL